MTRWVRVVLLALGLTACSDDVAGKKNGAACTLHEECASKLCTRVDGGAGDAGKSCVEPGLR